MGRRQAGLDRSHADVEVEQSIIWQKINESPDTRQHLFEQVNEENRQYIELGRKRQVMVNAFAS